MRRLIGQRKKPFAYSGKNTQQKVHKRAFESRSLLYSITNPIDNKEWERFKMKEFKYGVVYIVERTETSIEAFELASRGKDFIEVYVRKYTPATNELIGHEVRLHVLTDDYQEWVSYKNNISASQHYQGDLCIFTKEGLKNYDEKKN